jgi:type II secretory pathway component PulK
MTMLFNRPRSCCRLGSERGAALVVAMILLFILTLLAATGMSMSTAELTMAGNEQFHRRASDAAAAGIEAAVARVAVTPASISEIASDEYGATLRYAGDESSLPQSSADKFVGRHIEIESTGHAARHASDVQIQGVMVITAVSGVATYGQVGAGLQGGSAP